VFSDRSQFPGLTVQEYTGDDTDVLIASWKPGADDELVDVPVNDHTNPWIEVGGEPVNWMTGPSSPAGGNDCYVCYTEPVPGVLTATDLPDGVQRCDTCGRFDSDLAAAKALADQVGGRVMFYAE
jgi:hypothetical protein